MNIPVTFESARLRLRQWRASDRAPFAALNGDPIAMEFFPATLTPVQSDAMADRLEGLIAERGWGLWVVEVKTTGDFAGYVGLHVPRPELPMMPCVEIGWRLARGFWGRGYATEAAREVLRVGFEGLGLDEIVSFTAVGNTRSWAVMEQLGMVRDADTFEHPLVEEGSPLRTHVLYRIARRAWLGKTKKIETPGSSALASLGQG
jgi:RimJ/RimL family protein N-acetyltransferase